MIITVEGIAWLNELLTVSAYFTDPVARAAIDMLYR